jgi:hypothetical protein
MMLAPDGAMSAANSSSIVLVPARSAAAGTRTCAPLATMPAAICPFARTAAAARLGPRKSRIASSAPVRSNVTTTRPRAVSRPAVTSSRRS